MPRGWKLLYCGLTNAMPGGPARNGMKPGHLCVKASCYSKLIGREFRVCLGVGKPEGRKMPIEQVKVLLQSALAQAERAKFNLQG